MSKISKQFLAAAALATVMAQPMMASAADVDFNVRIGPPAPRAEPAPAPRVGYVWTPGYWAWRNNRHVWVGGVYVKERPGYAYTPRVWVQRDGKWHQSGGSWIRRDGDRDGIPNRLDRDRDNDGLRNRPDDHPRNPNRN